MSSLRSSTGATIQLPSIYAVGWIHLYDEPPESYGGLLETDGAKKPGYFAWRDG